MAKNIEVKVNVKFWGKVDCPKGAIISLADGGNRTGSYAEPTDSPITHVLQGDKFVAVSTPKEDTKPTKKDSSKKEDSNKKSEGSKKENKVEEEVTEG